MLKVSPPNGEKKVLLHTCCAPCSSAIIECLISNQIQPTIFYYNPNIYPETEYLKRKTECIRHAESLGIPFVDADYHHDQWLSDVKGLENEAERGKRCLQCFILRLTETARYASAHGFSVITTTLASSRWKDIDQINEAGIIATKLFPDICYWDQNWRKGGLSERRNAIIKEYNFYKQPYCGCEFSNTKSVIHEK